MLEICMSDLVTVPLDYFISMQSLDSTHIIKFILEMKKNEQKNQILKI